MVKFIIDNPHFLLVWTTALVSLLMSVVLYLKAKNPITLNYLIFFFISIVSSSQSVINVDNPNLSNLIFSLFFTYDFYFLFRTCKNIVIVRYNKICYILLSISVISLFVFLIKFPYSDLSIRILTIINSVCTLILCLPVVISLFKDRENKIEIDQYQFWIISGFMINGVASLISALLLTSNFATHNKVIYLLLFLTMYITWIVKYLMILKSNICIVKSFKLGD
jgi:hypothetical protein